jgi:type VI secretion system protein VasI
MKAIAFLILLFAGVLCSRAGELKEYLAVCSKVEAAQKRLECYDSLANAERTESGGVEKAAVRPAAAGKWKVEVERNRSDDTKTVFLMLGANIGRTNWGEPIILLLRCKSGVPSAYINWNEYLGDGPAAVGLRIGAGELKTMKWSLSKDSKAAFYPGSFHGLAAELLQNETLIATIVPGNGKPLAAVFDIRGLRGAMAPLRDACAGANPGEWSYLDTPPPAQPPADKPAVSKPPVNSGNRNSK